MIVKIICWIIVAAIGILLIINKLNSKRLIKTFKKGNVIVSGLRGMGKDLVFCYVINKRKENYISNVCYSDPKKKYKWFEFSKRVWELNGNSYKNFMNEEIKPYVYPYPDGIDYYISDCGIYFPAHMHKVLDKEESGAPIFQALSRQIGDCNIHLNSQRRNRVWDKMREQSDLNIVMRGAKVIGKLIFIKWTEYDKDESADNQVKKPYFGIGKKAREAKRQFEVVNGRIKNSWLIGLLPYNYDSRRFKKVLENGGIDNEREARID